MNLNQDGSDERTPSSGGELTVHSQISNHDNAHLIGIGSPTERTQSLPCVISLRLLDSKDKPIASQLAAFANSYDASQIHTNRQPSTDL